MILGRSGRACGRTSDQAAEVLVVAGKQIFGSVVGNDVVVLKKLLRGSEAHLVVKDREDFGVHVGRDPGRPGIGVGSSASFDSEPGVRKRARSIGLMTLRAVRDGALAPAHHLDCPDAAGVLRSPKNLEVARA